MASRPPSVRVIEKVAHKEGIPATELSPPLSKVVDPDALDALVQPGGESPATPVTVEFEYRDTVVRIQGDSTVRVTVDETYTSADAAEATQGQVGEIEE